MAFFLSSSNRETAGCRLQQGLTWVTRHEAGRSYTSRLRPSRDHVARKSAECTVRSARVEIPAPSGRPECADDRSPSDVNLPRLPQPRRGWLLPPGVELAALALFLCTDNGASVTGAVAAPRVAADPHSDQAHQPCLSGWRRLRAYTWGVLNRLLDEGMARGRDNLRLSMPKTPSGLA